MFNRLLMRTVALLAIIAAASTAGFYAGAQGKEPEKPKSTLSVNQIARVGPRIITAEQVIARTIDIEQTIKDEQARIVTGSINYLVQVSALPGQTSGTNGRSSSRDAQLPVGLCVDRSGGVTTAVTGYTKNSSLRGWRRERLAEGVDDENRRTHDGGSVIP